MKKSKKFEYIIVGAGFDLRLMYAVNYRHLSLALTNGNTTSCSVINFFNSISAAGMGPNICKYTSLDGWNGLYSTNFNFNFGAAVKSFYFMQVVDNGTNRIYYVSLDGRKWYNLLSTLSTDFITPTYYGIFIHSENTSVSTTQPIFDATVFHWLVTSP